MPNRSLMPDASDDPLDSLSGRAAPLRRARPAKAARSRKCRRKGANAHGGIHLRANKRISW